LASIQALKQILYTVFDPANIIPGITYEHNYELDCLSYKEQKVARLGLCISMVGMVMVLLNQWRCFYVLETLVFHVLLLQLLFLQGFAM